MCFPTQVLLRNGFGCRNNRVAVVWCDAVCVCVSTVCVWEWTWGGGVGLTIGCCHGVYMVEGSHRQMWPFIQDALWHLLICLFPLFLPFIYADIKPHSPPLPRRLSLSCSVKTTTLSLKGQSTLEIHHIIQPLVATLKTHTSKGADSECCWLDGVRQLREKSKSEWERGMPLSMAAMWL